MIIKGSGGLADILETYMVPSFTENFYLNNYKEENIKRFQRYVGIGHSLDCNDFAVVKVAKKAQLCILEKYKPFKVVSCHSLYLATKVLYQRHEFLVSEANNDYSAKKDKKNIQNYTWNTHLTRLFLVQHMVELIPVYPSTWGTYKNINDWLKGDRFNTQPGALWQDIAVAQLNKMKSLVNEARLRKTDDFIKDCKYIYFKIGDINFFLKNTFDQEKYLAYKGIYCLSDESSVDKWSYLCNTITNEKEKFDLSTFLFQLDYYKKQISMIDNEIRYVLVITALSLNWLICNLDKEYVQKMITHICKDIDEIKIIYTADIDSCPNISLLEGYMERKYGIQIFTKERPVKKQEYPPFMASLLSNSQDQSPCCVKNLLSDADTLNYPLSDKLDARKSFDVPGYRDFFTGKMYMWQELYQAKSLVGILNLVPRLIQDYMLSEDDMLPEVAADKQKMIEDDMLPEVATDKQKMPEDDMLRSVLTDEKKAFFNKALESVHTIRFTDEFFVGDSNPFFLKYILEKPGLTIHSLEYLRYGKSILHHDGAFSRHHTREVLRKYKLMDLFYKRIIVESGVMRFNLTLNRLLPENTEDFFNFIFLLDVSICIFALDGHNINRLNLLIKDGKNLFIIQKYDVSIWNDAMNLLFSSTAYLNNIDRIIINTFNNVILVDLLKNLKLLAPRIVINEDPLLENDEFVKQAIAEYKEQISKYKEQIGKYQEGEISDDEENFFKKLIRIVVYKKAFYMLWFIIFFYCILKH